MALEQARKEANLRLLQRSSDPTINNILGSATHTVLYEFQQSTQTWEKCNVEGSLFLAVRPSGYMLIILNRSSPDNFVQSLERDFQLQHKDPYLIFKQQSGGATIIRGIWFPNPQERVQMNDLLMQLLQTLRNQPPPPVAPAPAVVPAAPAHPSATNAASNIDPGSAIAALLSPLSLGAESNTVSSNPTGIPGQSTLAPTSNNRNPRHVSPSGGQTPVLDKKSLQLALLSLIQDDRFLDLLHAQYLKVAHARANRTNRPPSSDS